MKNRKHKGKYDYSVSYEGHKYLEGYNYHGQTTSVRIFKWVPTADGKRLKKSAGVHRVRGPISMIKEIELKAGDICDRMDSGEEFKTKTTTIK